MYLAHQGVVHVDVHLTRPPLRVLRVVVEVDRTDVDRVVQQHDHTVQRVLPRRVPEGLVGRVHERCQECVVLAVRCPHQVGGLPRVVG